MALVRASRDLQIETYTQDLIAGIDHAVSEAGGSFLVKIVPDAAAERAIYKRWAASPHIQWVLLEDFTVDDTRLPYLESLGLKVVVLDDVEVAGERPAVWTDNAGATRLAVDALYAAGHRSIARVAGPSRYRHARARTEALETAGAELGITTAVVQGDYSYGSGYEAVAAMLAAPIGATALLFDNDLMALGGLAALKDADVAVPGDVSIVAWDDSVRCQMAIPALAALSHDVREAGELAGNALVAAREGRITRVQTPPPTLVRRASFGSPRHVEPTTASPPDGVAAG